MHKLQKLIEEEYKYVAKLGTPTEVECEKLVAKFGMTLIEDILEQMDNFKPLLKRYRSTYRTINNWCKMAQPKETRKPFSPILGQKMNEWRDVIDEAGKQPKWRPN